MSGDTTTIARPYAEAIFTIADETDKLDLWSEMLGLLSAVVEDPDMAAIIANPTFEARDQTELMLEIGGGHLNDEGTNLVRLLVQNARLSLLPEITELFEKLKAEKDQMLNVHITTAFALRPIQEKQLADALKTKLGREVSITSEKDPALIGGVSIRAGDLVIDGSIRGRLQQLANELGI